VGYRIRDYKYTLLLAVVLIAIFVVFGILTKKADSCQETGGTLVKNWKGTYQCVPTR
jgi:hypothetical protein